MGTRVYTMEFSGVAVSAVQDLLAIYTGVKAIRVHEVVLGQTTATTTGNLGITLKRMNATVTSGSGGAAGVIVPINPGDAAATVTGRTNDTTQATATTDNVLRGDVVNVLNGYQYLPPPDDRPVIEPSGAFVVSLNTAPASSETFSGTITFEELF
jgi:hypothetical protein